jgi:DNA-binding NarL/FixJ family response regulator
MRVLIIAEHKQAAEAIGRALRYGPPCRVIGYLSTRGAGEGISWHVSADVVVIDERRPDARTARLVRAIRAAVPDAKLVLLTDDMDAGRLVRDVAAGRVYHAFERPRAGASASAGPAAASVLTSRELEILRLVAGGLPNGSIAKRLFVTEQTVKFHLSNVYRKLGLRNRTEASHYAHVHGLLEPESDVEIRGSVPVAA